MEETNTVLAPVSTLDSLRHADMEFLHAGLTAETKVEKARLYNAISDPQEKLKDHFGSVIALTGWVAKPVHDDESGDDYIFMVLIDENGVTYSTGANGVMQSLRDLTALNGSPDEWDEPLQVIPYAKDVKKGHTIKLRAFVEGE